ncbi:septal ring lytic transglycosylase RlpA family protein [Rhizobium sp. P32RR-XVIII]|nr:septal ring lytic transglycosylase RlpA family protein [Rhizobium sp. P32RR-XVIII]
MACACCATCTTTQAPNMRSKGYVSEKLYGVKARPRVAYGKKIPGSRYMLGGPYVVKGKRYYPKEDPDYDRKGVASWYGSAFQGRRTANGEVYDADHLSAAHPTLPLPSYVRVTNLENGSSLIVRINDRGPYHKGRIIDVSSKAADMLDLKHSGTASVRVQYVGRARLGGDDMPDLIASYIKKDDRFPAVNPEPRIATGVIMASKRWMGDYSPSDSQSLRSTQTNLAEHTPSASYQTAAKAAAAFQTFEQFVMLSETGNVTLERPPEHTPSLSRNVAIASLDQDVVFLPDGKVRNLLTPAVTYCLGKDGHDGVREMCEFQGLPLPGRDRNKHLTGVVSIRRRCSCQHGYRWRQQSALPGVRKGPSRDMPGTAVERQQSVGS